MLQFIYGRAGSGKSTLLFDKIGSLTEKGEKAFLIVPEQHVFETEKKLCVEGRGGLDIEVAGFRRLSNMIFRKFGGLCYHYIGKGAKLIVMWRTLRRLEGFLSEYGAVSIDDLSLLKMLQSTVEEFQRYNITPRMLEKAASELPREDEKLRRKLLDLSQITTLDLALLHDNYDNPEEDLSRAAKLLDEHDFFGNITVFFDGFQRFSPSELEIVKNVFRQAKDVCITIPCLPGDRSEMTDNIRKSERMLKRAASDAGCRLAPPIVCDGQYGTSCVDLAFLRANIWGRGDTAYPDVPENISVTEAADIYSEAEAAACMIAHLVMDEGVRYRDIAIIMRDPGQYNGILDGALEQYGIPCFMSSRTGLCMKPCVRLIGSALSVFSGRWRLEDVISYMRCGLSGLSSEECDMLEEYACAWRISGALWYAEDDWTMNPQGFSTEFTDEDAEKLAVLATLRDRLVSPLVTFGQIFDANPTVRDVSASLFGFLEAMNIPEKLAEEEARLRLSGDPAAAEECVQIWDVIGSALDSLVTVAGDMHVGASSYYKLLFAVFDSVDIGKVPARADEVIIGEPKLLHKPGIRHAFILGLNEGVFPSAGAENAVFGDAEKEKLGELGIELADNSESALSGELFGFYRAVSMPEKSLHLLYHADLNKSVALFAVESLFPELKTVRWSEVDRLYKVCNKTTAIEYFAENMKNRSDGKLSGLLCGYPDCAERIAALGSPIGEENCTVSRKTADKMTENGLNLTQARIENYVKCPFSFYAKNVLALKEPANDDFEARDVGNYIHAVFERFFSLLGGRQLKTLTDDEAIRILEKAISDCRKKVIRGKSTARLEHLFSRLEKLSGLFVRNMLEEFRCSDFEPTFFELAIDNRPGNIAPLKIGFGNGKTITVYGRVDRVDTYKSGNDTYLRVVDYKTGKKSFSLSDIKLGLDFQMPIYLFSICKTKNTEFLKKLAVADDGRLLPAGVLYFSARVPESIKVDDPMPDMQSVNEKLSSSVKRSGLLIDDPELIYAMDHRKSGKFIPVKYDKDGNPKKDGSLIDADGFEELLAEISEKISAVGDEIASGRACASPMKTDDIDPCRYCGAKKLCRISEKKS